MHTTIRRPLSRSVRRRRASVIATALVFAATFTTAAIALTFGDNSTSAHEGPASDHPLATGALGDDDGYIATGDTLSPFADDLPAIARLDSALREAMQAAATAAIDDGFTFVVTSAWRSERYQQSLFDDALQKYGSTEEASKWVSSPENSKHVTGEAVDIGFTDANSWLSQHGADYGLCQVYANEMWHFELATTPGGQCPPQLSDASHPRV